MMRCDRCVADDTSPLGRRLRLRRSTLRAVYFGLVPFAVFAYQNPDRGGPTHRLAVAAINGGLTAALVFVIERSRVHFRHKERRGQFVLLAVVLFATVFGAGLLVADLLLRLT
jgi:hypothetical protein